MGYDILAAIGEAVIEDNPGWKYGISGNVASLDNYQLDIYDTGHTEVSIILYYPVGGNNPYIRMSLDYGSWNYDRNGQNLILDLNNPNLILDITRYIRHY